jgi:hypothetical protein
MDSQQLRSSGQYTLHLMERIKDDTYLSIAMMQRVQRLVARWGLELPPRLRASREPASGARRSGRAPGADGPRSRHADQIANPHPGRSPRAGRPG